MKLTMKNRTNAYMVYQIFVTRGEHEINPINVDKLIVHLIEKADRIRSHSKKTGDKAINASNDFIEFAEIVTNLFHLAGLAPKKYKKQFHYRGLE